jgi:cytidine deaminase
MNLKDLLLFKKLAEKARKALENSYSPYSKFKVGAALLCKNGKIYTGTNIENASYGLTVCAERVAVFKAISENEKDFKAIAISSGGKKPCVPCGACLQVLNEFSSDIMIILDKGRAGYEMKQLKEFLPRGFNLRGAR